jgi:hypothetical protein
MQAIDAGSPLRGWMLQQCGAVVLHIPRQVHLQRVLNLRRLQEHPQQCGGREVCDGERLSSEISATLPFVLDAVERGRDNGSILLQIAFADSMTKSVERWKHREQRPKRAVGLAAHARCQHAQRNVWIALKQRRHDSRAQRRAKRLVEIVLQCERALPRCGIARIKRRVGVMLLKRSDDVRGIGDGPAIEPQDG